MVRNKQITKRRKPQKSLLEKIQDFSQRLNNDPEYKDLKELFEWIRKGVKGDS